MTSGDGLERKTASQRVGRVCDGLVTVCGGLRPANGDTKFTLALKCAVKSFEKSCTRLAIGCRSIECIESEEVLEIGGRYEEDVGAGVWIGGVVPGSFARAGAGANALQNALDPRLAVGAR